MISATDASVPVFGLIYENSSALKNGAGIWAWKAYRRLGTPGEEIVINRL
jgi:hypothetical protein